MVVIRSPTNVKHTPSFFSLYLFPETTGFILDAVYVFTIVVAIITFRIYLRANF